MAVRSAAARSSSRRRPRFRWLRDRPGLEALVFVVLVAFVVLVVAGLVALWKLRSVASDLRHARNILQTVEQQVSDGQLAAARSNLSQAQRIISRANSRVYGGIEFDLIDWLPVVHQNIHALRSSVGLAYTMVSGGAQILDVSRPLQGPNGKLEVSLDKGGIPLRTVVAAQRATAQLASVLPGSSQQPSSSGLIGPVADLQRSVHDEAVARRRQLEILSRGMALLDDMAGANGARRYLIAVANTAEERGAGGMILSYGELDAANGRFTLGPFGNVGTLPAVTTHVGDQLPDDFRRRWDGYAYDTNFRQATLGADFPTVAPVLGQLYTTATGKPVDGVIQIDPAGLAAILQAIGPVDVPGVGRVSADNLVDFTVNQAYFLFQDRDQRENVLGDVARACFDRLLNGDYPSMRQLASSLSDAVGGRHLLMWSTQSVASTQLRFFDADGAMPAPDSDYLSLTLQNMSGNKLDYYMDTALDVRSVAAPKGDTRRFVDVQVSLHNTAPTNGTLQYVFGPFEAPLQRGLYHGVASLYVPTGTELQGVDGPTGTPAAVYTEGGREVVSFEVNTRASTTDTFTIHLALLPSASPIGWLLVPQARVRPTTARVNLTASGTKPIDASVTLTGSWLLQGGRAPIPASGPKTASSRIG
ncbi:MAG TPA: DUF4012 domain-containing protein [Acidimicrobiales bacterium]|jgi:hypothetical protein|nr:DUF4012 domain-containing protein [Acidimicrobiales bacterium]